MGTALSPSDLSVKPLALSQVCFFEHFVEVPFHTFFLLILNRGSRSNTVKEPCTSDGWKGFYSSHIIENVIFISWNNQNISFFFLFIFSVCMTIINVSLSKDMSEKPVICELTYCTSTVKAVFPSKVSKETLPKSQWLNCFNCVFALKCCNVVIKSSLWIKVFF